MNRIADALGRADALIVKARELFASANLAHARGASNAGDKTREALAILDAARVALAADTDESEADE